jgi:hypothetical protein
MGVTPCPVHWKVKEKPHLLGRLMSCSWWRILNPLWSLVWYQLPSPDFPISPEGWERGERGKSQRWGSSYQTGDQGGWEFITTSKKLALQVSRVFLLFLEGVR